MDFSQDCGSADLETGRPGSVPFVFHQPGAYGRLLLAVYVEDGFLGCIGLAASCYVGGGWRAAPPVTTRSMADVS